MSAVVYVDTSVVLAAIRTERQRPTTEFWRNPLLLSSVLAEYETWTRLHAYGETAALAADAASTLGAINLVALTPEIGARCRSPFPVPVRTLDALHLATAEHLRNRGYLVEVATYETRMRDIAAAMGFALTALTLE